MNIIDVITKWIYHIELPAICSDEQYIIPKIKHQELTKHNPETGLPMIGGLDVMGNLIGTDRQSDYSHHINSMDNYYRYYSR